MQQILMKFGVLWGVWGGGHYRDLRFSWLCSLLECDTVEFVFQKKHTASTISLEFRFCFTGLA